MSTRSQRLADALIPPSPTLRLDQVHITETTSLVSLISIATTSTCPQCQQPATRVRGSYMRTLADLPWGGVAVQIHLHVRKFACDVRHCAQRIFTERMPDVTMPYARRTNRLTEVMRCIAFAAGGEGGSRVLARLRMAASGATLLRLIRRTPLPTPATPRVLGVDDWARRKGQTYGSLLVDLEQHRPIDLLPDRTATTFATWLQAQPGVEIISRDRAGAYADGATTGAPAAIQVADRWHLLRNLGDALERVLQEHAASIKQVCMPPPPLGSEGGAALHVAKLTPRRTARTQALSEHRRAARLERYTTVKELHQRGLTLWAIADQVGLNRKTVQRWVYTSTFPERMARPTRPSRLDPYKAYLLERWNAGCHNAARLWHELRAQGYTGGCTSVRDYLAQFRAHDRQCTRTGSNTRLPSRAQRDRPPTARQWVGLVLRRPDRLTEQEHAAVQQMRAAHSQVNAAVRFSQEFTTMVRDRQPEDLEPWLWRVASSDVAALRSFAAGIQRDKAAVLAGLTLQWSQGQVEGHITRLKLVKRSTYGRAKLDLLRQRMLYVA